MALTRRNTIIGLGGLAVGAGLIGGSGAFDTVEAQRSFEVSVASDEDALLGIEALNDAIAGTEAGGAGGNDIIFFELDTDDSDRGINEDATTEFFEVFAVTNNGSNTIELTVEYGDADGIAFIVKEEWADNGDIVDSDVTLSADTGVTIEPGQTVHIDLTIDTTQDGGYTEPDGDPYDITLNARSEQAQD